MKISTLIRLFIPLCLIITNGIHAQQAPGALPPSPPQTSTMTQKLAKFFDGPQGILIISGIATVYSGILYKAADKQEEESKENIKKIEKLLTAFNDSFINYCPTGRNDLKNPQCYCYTDDRKKNSNRTNSQICQELWKKSETILNTDPTNYLTSLYSPDVAGCITVSGQFDENCQCRKFVDEKGKNACQKSATLSLPSSIGTGFGESSGLKNVAQLMANAGAGNPRFDLMKTGQLLNRAINAQKIAGELGKKILNNKDKNGRPKMIEEKNVGQITQAAVGKDLLDRSLQGGPSSSIASLGSYRNEGPKASELLDAMSKKAGLELEGTGLGLNKKRSEDKNDGFALDIGNSSNANGVMAGNVQEFAEKSYQYKNSDVATDESASIFEIISNRYIQSGLRRLFDQ